MLKLKGLSLVILVIIILNSCHSKSGQSASYKYGWENRLMTALIDMNCSEDNMAIYSGFNAYRLSSNQYDIVSSKDDIGKANFAFKINFIDTSIISKFKDVSISFCKDGKTYIGRGQPSINSHIPPACHFFFFYDDDGIVSKYSNGELTCMSTPFLSPDDYAEKVLGINN